MLFSNISIIDENYSVKKNIFVGVKGNIIDYISSEKPSEDYGEVYNGNGKLLIPSFYNAHSHLPMHILRGYGENLSLMNWLNKKIFPFEAKLTEDDIYYSCLAGVAEMLRYGIGYTNDMYLDQRATARAFWDSGIRAHTNANVTCFDDRGYKELPLYGETIAAIKKFNKADNDRVTVNFSLHAEYTSTEKVIRGLAEVAKEMGSSIHVHVSESKTEVNECRSRHKGMSPVEYLNDCGLFDVPTIAAHCIHLDRNDMEILKEKNVTVATCPKSNLKLSSGVCQVTTLLETGINVAIGTDSVASNNNLNMIEEMRFFNLLQKGYTYNPTAITPAQTLYAATRAGALGAGIKDGGLIKEGFKADLAVLDIDKIYMHPEYNLLNNLIFSASGSDVVLTMVDGKVLYKDGEYTTIDIDMVKSKCQESINRIVNS